MYTYTARLVVFSSDVFEDPGDELRNPGADSGEVGLGAADSPRDDSGEEVAAIFAPDLQGTSGVALAGITAAVFVAGTQENVRDELVPSGTQEHAFAPVVAHYGNLNLEMK